MTKHDFVKPDDINGFIFDCDGTIADTMPLHYQAYQQALGNDADCLTSEVFYEQAGVPAEKFLEMLKTTHNRSFDPSDVAQKKEKIFGELLHRVDSIQPVEIVVREWHGKVPMAVASGGTRENVERTLDLLGLLALFDTVVCSEDVEHGKPSPDMFLEAARRINVPSAECLVFEDGDKGIEAAAAAGMQWEDVRTW